MLPEDECLSVAPFRCVTGPDYCLRTVEVYDVFFAEEALPRRQSRFQGLDVTCRLVNLDGFEDTLRLRARFVVRVICQFFFPEKFKFPYPYIYIIPYFERNVKRKMQNWRSLSKKVLENLPRTWELGGWDPPGVVETQGFSTPPAMRRNLRFLKTGKSSVNCHFFLDF